MRIILLTPLYYLDLYTTNICLRCLSLALVHASKAELGLLVFIPMDSRRTPTTFKLDDELHPPGNWLDASA